MTEKEIAHIILLARRAPLRNMNEADAVGQLLDRFADWARQVLQSEDEIIHPVNAGGSS